MVEKLSCPSTSAYAARKLRDDGGQFYFERNYLILVTILPSVCSTRTGEMFLFLKGRVEAHHERFSTRSCSRCRGCCDLFAGFDSSLKTLLPMDSAVAGPMTSITRVKCKPWLADGRISAIFVSLMKRTKE